MRLLLPLIALLLATAAHAQSASDRYHEAARLFIAGEKEGAERAAEAGLALAPNDARLRALLERIRRQPPDQPQGGGQQPQQPQPNEGQQNQQRPDQPRGNEASQAPPDRPEPSDNPAARDQTRTAPREGEREERDERQPLPPPTGRPDAPRPGQGSPTPDAPVDAARGRMTREEAERILNALGADEREVLRTLPRPPTRPRRTTRDW
ncbi:MAG TPA: hypothetical protein VD962_13470 [Rubricoccaceae bacterium]|nr:hypothetical protein [Rubricoccaceae bacterium]